MNTPIIAWWFHFLKLPEMQFYAHTYGYTYDYTYTDLENLGNAWNLLPWLSACNAHTVTLMLDFFKAELHYCFTIVHLHARAHTASPAPTYVLAHIHANVGARACMHTHATACIRKTTNFTHAHIPTYPHRRTHTHAHAHAPAHTHKQTRACKCKTSGGSHK